MVKLPYRPKRAFLSSAIFLPPTGELNSQLTACAPNNAVRARPFTLIHRLLSYIIIFDVSLYVWYLWNRTRFNLRAWTLYYLNQGGPGQVLVIVRLSVTMVKLPYRPKRAFLSSPRRHFVDTPSTSVVNDDVINQNWRHNWMTLWRNK